MGGLRLLNDAVERATGRRLMRRLGPGSVGTRPSLKAQADDLRIRAIYSAIGHLHLRRQVNVPNAIVDLRTAELQVFSQNGEDGVIDALVHALGIDSTYFVEFGVGDGSECNTRLLADVFGWAGLYIEPETVQCETLRTRHRLSSGVSCVNASVTPDNVNQLFADAKVPRDLGVLSIDVDGQDYWIWQALSSDFQPDVVVIECNTAFARGSKVVEIKGLGWSEDFSDSFGASIDALADLGEEKGYSLVHVDLAGVNAFFVRRRRLEQSHAVFVGNLERGPNFSLQGKGHPITKRRPTVSVGQSGARAVEPEPHGTRPL